MGASITSLGRKKSLSSLLQYVANPSKKEKCVAVSGINCSEELQKTLQQMNRTRTKLNHSKDITQAYHLVHSFDRDTSKKLNKEVMHAIAVEFAEKSFPNCQVFVASHNDKKHFHSHIVINNIDMETAKRIRIDPKNLDSMRQMNDQILQEHGLESIDNEYYENLETRKNIYSNDSSRLKNGQVNQQEQVQQAIEMVLADYNVDSFEIFSEELAKKHDIEVYKFSKNSNKLGYVLYKPEAKFYENRDLFVALGKDKESRKQREKFVERTFSARKLGKKFSYETVHEQFEENNLQKIHHNFFNGLGNYDSEQMMAITSGLNKDGELIVPFVELDERVNNRLISSNNHKKSIFYKSKYVSYESFLKSVDHFYDSTIYPEDDEAYQIKLHTHVDLKSLRSTNYKTIQVEKTETKRLYSASEGWHMAPHTPTAQQLHYQISRAMNDDVKMYRAKQDYEFMERIVQQQQQRQQGFDMDY